MPTSKGSSTLQDCYNGLEASVKRKQTGERLSTSKRQRILQEQLPVVVLTQASVAKRNDSSYKQDSSKTKDAKDESEEKSSGITTDTIKYLQEQQELVKKENDKIEERRKAFFKKQSDIIGVYMFGLEKISKLTDVRDAPDAILPGNQV